VDFRHPQARRAGEVGAPIRGECIMHMSMAIAALLGAAQGAATPPPGAPLSIDLLCRGDGERFQQTELKRRDKDGKTVSKWVRDRIPFYGAVELRVRGATAQARVPNGMLAEYDEGGWREVRKLVVTDDKIDGKIHFGVLYAPVMTISRVTGEIAISGSMSNFSGSCEPYEPERDRRF
jgi:hypothetical protein